MDLQRTTRRAETFATASSCCGFLGEVTLTDSAVIILFASMLGAGDTLSLLTTSVFPFLNGVFLIPMACFVMKVGARRVVLTACCVASVAYFAAAAAPLCSPYQVPALIGAILVFCLSLTGFVAGWFPILDTFLVKERRAEFFGRMRFAHQSVATLFLFVVSRAIGEEPQLRLLQCVLLTAAVIFAFRGFFISKIDAFPKQKMDCSSFWHGIAMAIENKALVGFSLYVFVLNLTSFGTVPLMFLCLRNEFGVPDNVIVSLSAVALCGMMAGYLTGGTLIKRLGVKCAILCLHAIFFTVNMLLFLMREHGAVLHCAVGGCLFLYSLGIAVFSIVFSAEMMRLAAPENKEIAMACTGALSCLGGGLSRLASSLALGGGVLASRWAIGSLSVSRYHTVLLLYSLGILFASFFLLVVPSVFPEGNYSNVPDSSSPNGLP